ncbi:MAG: hypothetical protein SGARI_007458 [Bacillariaceae sp.]
MFRISLLFSLLGLVAAFCPAPLTPSSALLSKTALNVAIDTSDIKNGMTIELDGEPYKVLNFSIMKQARGAAKTTIKFKNLMKGNTIENTYRSGEKFQTAQIDKSDHQFTYQDGVSGSILTCRNLEVHQFRTEQVPVDSKAVADKEQWIEEGKEVSLVFFKGSVIEVVVPSTDVFEIVETEPNVKGNTAQGYTKPATLSCGATISVPGYLEQGELIKVDTDKGAFLERANK